MGLVFLDGPFAQHPMGVLPYTHKLSVGHFYQA